MLAGYMKWAITGEAAVLAATHPQHIGAWAGRHATEVAAAQQRLYEDAASAAASADTERRDAAERHIVEVFALKQVGCAGVK